MTHAQLHRAAAQLEAAERDRQSCALCTSRLPCWRPEHSWRERDRLASEALALARLALGRQEAPTARPLLDASAGRGVEHESQGRLSVEPDQGFDSAP